jgi:hypothetical protein
MLTPKADWNLHPVTFGDDPLDKYLTGRKLFFIGVGEGMALLCRPTKKNLAHYNQRKLANSMGGSHNED